MVSEIVLLIERQKALLLAKDATLARSLARQWMEVIDALEAELLKTATAFEGEALVTEAMILRNSHFQKLLWQARAEYAKYADGMDEAVTEAQKKMLALGVADATGVIEFAVDGIVFDRLNVRAIEALLGFSADGSPLRDLLMKGYGDAVNGIVRELLAGLAKGLNPRDIAEAMADGFGVGLDRALRIARTEVMRAYRLGSLEQYRQSGVVTQYMRLAKKDATTCLGCLFTDGEVFDSADEFSEHPNGRCVVVPVVRGAALPVFETGTDWFMKQPVATQLEMLGQERFDAWQNGAALRDMSSFVSDPVWGGSFVPTPVNQFAARD